MILDPNPLYYWMLKKFSERDRRDKLILCNEGSSRSSKTFEGFRFLATYCDHNRGSEKDIYVFRDTLTNCRDYTIKDFKRCLGREGMGIYEERHMTGLGGKPQYNLFGQTINFRGLDQDSEAARSDFLYFNELLECDKPAFDGWLMRNEVVTLADWNPRYTAHWAFDLEKRPNCFFSKTTYKHNKFLPESVVRGIESLSPWLLEDMHLEEDKRRPHLDNIKAGTADKYQWLVYGCGIRSSKEGLMFPNVTFVNAIPKDVEQISYGMDFGTTAQTAIVRTAFKRKEGKSDLYLQKLFYAPTQTSDEVNEILNELAKTYPGLGTDAHIWADNNKPGWIADLRESGKSIFPTVKFPGSRDYWIQSIKKFNIHIVRDVDFQKEQENFAHRVVDGITLSESIKKWDHLWSASGYSVVGDLRDFIGEPEEKEGGDDE